MPVLKYLACVLAAFFGLSLAAPVYAQPAMIALGEPCLLAGAPQASPATLITSQSRFACQPGASLRDVDSAWALFSNVQIPPLEQDRWVFRHRNLRAAGEQVWFRFDDGTVLPSTTKAHDAVQMLSSADIIYHAPAHPGAIDAILIRAEGLQNAHGIAPDAHMETASSLAERMGGFRLFYGLFTGMMFVTLLYTLMVHSVLKHRFLLAYAAFTASMMLFGLSWGGGFFGVFDGFTTLDQVRLNFVSVALALASATWFLISFVEPEMLSAKARQRLLGFALLPLAVALGRNLNLSWEWRLIDTILIIGFTGTIIALYGTALLAVRRGSASARLLVIGWTLPALVGVARMGWAIGLINWHHAMFDIAIFVVILLEIAVMTAGVAWRIRELRAERDESRARELALTHLAECDSLTGVFNRSAFMAHAMADDCAKRLVLVRIERFRMLNERYGHHAGDEVLITLARCLRGAAPERALVGRLSGAEFAILVQAEDQVSLLRTVRKRLEGTSFIHDIKVTTSLGTALGQIVDPLSWKAIYSAADRALQAARIASRKRKGRDDMALAA